MIKESFLLFISAIVWNSLLLRGGIEDAFLFKKTHREEKSYYALLSRSPRFRILLPYREMIPCYAPRHMRFFQIAQKVNLTVLAVAGIICILSWKHRLTRAHREKQLKMSCQALHNAPPNGT